MICLLFDHYHGCPVADCGAQAAAGAQRCVDHTAIAKADGRTAGHHDAELAQVAVFVDHLDDFCHLFMADGLDGALPRARTTFTPGSLMAFCRTAEYPYIGRGPPQRTAPLPGPGQFLQYPLRHGPHSGTAKGAGIDLHAGHGCPAVIHDDQGQIDVVLDGIDQAGDAAVEEGGIADGGDDRCFYPGVNITLGQAYAGAHGDFVPDGVKGRVHAQDGAADIAGDHHFALF